jgi:hypothetical protein
VGSTTVGGVTGVVFEPALLPLPHPRRDSKPTAAAPNEMSVHEALAMRSPGEVPACGSGLRGALWDAKPSLTIKQASGEAKAN